MKEQLAFIQKALLTPSDVCPLLFIPIPANSICSHAQERTNGLFARDMMTHFFQTQEIFGSVFDKIQLVFERVLSMICAKGKRVLRVLEIGAGELWKHFFDLHSFDKYLRKCYITHVLPV
jgi:hypothetical protein